MQGRVRVWLLGLLASSAACTCSGDAPAVSVFAASSLSDAFGALEREFELQGPPVAVTYAGSQVLRLQIEQGAPADVFASADGEHVDALDARGLLARRAVFARNELVVIVPVNNPAAIEEFWDLERAHRIVVGAPEVPVGRYTDAVLEAAGRVRGETFERAVRDAIVSEESNVRLVRAKVELGEADAAFVYRTDATLGTNVRVVPIPADLRVTVEYHLAVLGDAADREPVRRFVDFIASDRGRALLTEHGFVDGP